MNSIRTGRLILRPWRQDDAEDLYKYASDPQVGPAAGWEPHKSPEDSLDILKTVLMRENTWAVTIEGSDEPVGCAGYFPSRAEGARGEPEIGYWLGRPFWGQGYIPEAVRALAGRCFQEGAERVWCSFSPDNLRSRRVAEKCGFGYRFRCPWTDENGEPGDDSLYYCLCREDWENG